jgi:hypothetical protein
MLLLLIVPVGGQQKSPTSKSDGSQKSADDLKRTPRPELITVRNQADFVKLLEAARLEDKQLKEDVVALRNESDKLVGEISTVNAELSKSQADRQRLKDANALKSPPELHIPDGWKPCPSDFANAGIRVGGVRYCSPLIVSSK